MKVHIRGRHSATVEIDDDAGVDALYDAAAENLGYEKGRSLLFLRDPSGATTPLDKVKSLKMQKVSDGSVFSYSLIIAK